MVGIAVFLNGVLPKLTALVWALLGYSFFMLYFGRMFEFPEIAARISPYGNIPQYPLESITFTPLAALCVITSLLCLAGISLYRRRDIGA
jgi:ABC-2 type transport system permease protein